MVQPYRDLRRILSRRRFRSLDRRSQARLLSISRFVTVEHAGRERLARCRNISDGGAKLDLRQRLAVGDRVAITFSPQDVVCGKVVWSDGHEHGIAFDELVDCVRILSGAGTLDGRPRYRLHA